MPVLKFISDFPHNVRNIEHAWIPLSDGTRLSARILLPEAAETTPVPAILEYMPYRKRDHNRNRDEMIYQYFAGHGYAGVRVDTRGSGESEGVLLDEFTTQEADDGVEVLNWIAAQRWCTGAIGMMGKSWSGFSALIMAARNPEPLKAIIPVCAGIDRYNQGLHYTGGCFQLDNLHWTTTMMMFNMRPPDPDIVGESFDEMWGRRLNANEPWIQRWLEHQHDDGYYRVGSVINDVENVSCAIHYVGGWADHFAKCVPQALTTFRSPVKGLVGPWAHYFPHDGEPGPKLGWLQYCLRWWDHWLKGEDSGILDEPDLIAYIMESARPQADFEVREGRWVAERTWPSPNVSPVKYYLNDCGLESAPRRGNVFEHRSPLSLGMAAAGDWCRLGVAGEEPLDQQGDDSQSLTFDTPPLDERVELLGAPSLTLKLAADQEVAMVAVRLNDVAPDGTSARVCYGILNLTHRNSHKEPEKLIPGESYTVTVPLHDIGYAFPPRHRIRVSISTSYWPYVWPSPNSATLSIESGESYLTLPVRNVEGEEETVMFEEAECAHPVQIAVLEKTEVGREFSKDLIRGTNRLSISYSGGYLGPGRYFRIEPPGTIIGHQKRHDCEIVDDDPLSAKYSVTQTYDMELSGMKLRFNSRFAMWATQDRFFTDIEASAYKNEEEIWSGRWQEDYARNLV